MLTGHPALILVVLIPLLGALLSYVLGQRSPSVSGWMATGASVLSFFVVLVLVSNLPEGVIFEQRVSSWISSGDLSLPFVLRFDALTAVMCLVVTGIGSLIHLYATAYMAEDASRPRFFAYLNLFMFAMLLLVLGGSLPVLFIGWEGVGLCSYLLIGFWFGNLDYSKAGRKAFVVNRIGDAGFLLGMFVLFRAFGTLDFVELSILVPNSAADPRVLALAALGLFIGATGKSAQIPLFVWLPDAMAGPTPVSALIHAATMVTAGVYLMARMNFLYALTPEVMMVVAVIALVTALMAGLIALTQNDIKKVLAYSTVSQLGFMFMAVSAGAYWVGIFHVATHAFFKACLFLAAGSVIHGCHHEQDMRHMGGLVKSMPITAGAYAVAVLAIAGIAPFAGYYSKHAIVAAVESSGGQIFHAYGGIYSVLVNLAAIVTAFYMTRSFALTFLGNYRGHAEPHESPWAMTSVLVVLGALSLAGGLVLAGPLGLSHYLSGVLPVEGEHAAEGVLSLIGHSWPGLLGVGLAYMLYTRSPALPGIVFERLLPLSRWSLQKFYVDELYEALILNPLYRLSKMTLRVVDQGLIDGSVNALASAVDLTGEGVRRVQTGQVRLYALLMFAGALAFLIAYMLL